MSRTGSLGGNLEDGLKIYGLFRGYIEHENNLINQRLTWLLSIHGFLYATCGLTLQKKIDVDRYISADLFMQEECKFPADLFAGACLDLRRVYYNVSPLWFTSIELYGFLFLLAVIGLCISVVGLGSIKAAINASSAVREIFEEQYQSHIILRHRKQSRYAFDIHNGTLVPGISGGGRVSLEDRGFRAATFIPWVLLVGWVIAIASGILYGAFAVHPYKSLFASPIPEWIRKLMGFI